MDEEDEEEEGATLLRIPHPHPPAVTQELWTRLHALPLSTIYLSRVSESISTNTDFWEQFKQGGGGGGGGGAGKEGEGGGGVGAGGGAGGGGGKEQKRVPKFPWQRDEGCVSLDDLVLLSCIDKPTALKVIGEEVARLTLDITPPLISELLDEAKGKPLLLVHDENRLVSEVNLSRLQEELQNATGVSKV